MFLTIPFYFYQLENINLLVRFLRVFAIPEYNSVFVLGLLMNMKSDYFIRMIQVLSVVKFYLWHSVTQIGFLLLILVVLTYLVRHPMQF